MKRLANDDLKEVSGGWFGALVVGAAMGAAATYAYFKMPEVQVITLPPKT